MLYKNVKALPPRDAYDPSEGAEVLRAIAGMSCDACDMPLPREDRMGAWNRAIPFTAYTCCGNAYCPFCGANARQRCEHLLAAQSSGQWRIAHLPDLSDVPVLHPPPVSPEHMLDHKTTQKRAAFGGAYPLLAPLYGRGLEGKGTSGRIRGELIVEKLLTWDNKQIVASGGKNSGKNTFYFAQDPRARTAHLDDTLRRALPGGFTELFALPQPALQYRLSVAQYAPGKPARALLVSPDGARVHILWDRGGAVFDVSVPEREPVFLRDIPAPQHGAQYLSACLADSERFLEASVENVGVRSAPYIEIVPLVPEPGDPNSEPCGTRRGGTEYGYESSLHGGRTVLQENGRSVRFYKAAANSNERGRPWLTISLRSLLMAMPLRPGGDTFALAAGGYLSLWRVPGSAIPEAPTSKPSPQPEAPVLSVEERARREVRGLRG
ncbi:MAG: hypothetical protein H7145_24435 [Akkermansiaceae bacterium]|nr:hypothetical protein [Armatimonadota bacterium]